MKIKHLILFILLGIFSCTQPNDKKEINQNLMTTDIHSFAKPQEVVMTHLALDIEVNFDKKIIQGKAQVSIKNNGKHTQLFLDTKDLTIQKITLDKEATPTKFQLEKPVEFLGQALIIDIKPETKYVTIEYTTSPKAAALQWLAPEQTAGKKYPFLFTQSQSILARTWAPCQDSPGIRFTYEAKVKVPKDLLALMSAENPTQKNEAGIYEFKMDKPIPAYLLALSVGDLTFKSLGERTGVYAEPATLEKATYEFADLEAMLKAAEKLYGKYEWGRYDLLVLPPSFPFGGMENPRITFATPTIIAGDKSLTSLVAHELAHSWSGNLVTNKTWNDFWLNEGFTVYFERRIMEAMYGHPYAEMLALLGYQDLTQTVEELGKNNKDTKLLLDLRERDPDEGVSDIAYEKGYFFIRLIEESVGREKFDKFLQAYFHKFSFQSMDTENFLKYLNQELLKDDSNLLNKIKIDDWVYGTGIPDNCPKVVSELFQNVDKNLTDWKNGKALDSLDTKNWSSHEWLHFIRHLPVPMSHMQMDNLDKAFHFTDSGNSEVLAAWFIHVINNKYEKSYEAMERFLVGMGRRKFLTPLYKAMVQTPEGKILAKKIYTKARPNYHFVAVNTMDELLGWKP